MSQPEPWIRGPIPGVSPLLMPAAHALLMAREDLEHVIAGIAPDELWVRPGGAASAGFHATHLAGSLDRLYTYARGESLSDEQLRVLHAESSPPDPAPSAAEVISAVHATLDRALAQLAATDEATLLEPREVGRKRLPSNVIGLLFHGAEHTQRHFGQLVTTAKIVRGLAQDGRHA
jgi:hypothetical protein